MRWRLPDLTGRMRRTLTVAAVYAVAAWVLWAWLPPSPRLSITLPEPGSPVTISRDGRTLITESEPQGESALITVRAWDGLTGRMRAAFTGISGLVRKVRVAPDGNLVAAVVSYRTGEDLWTTHLLLCDVPTGREVDRFLLQDVDGFGYYDAHFASDGQTLAFTTDVQKTRRVTLWDVSSRSVRAILEDQLSPLAFSPDGKTLATVTGISPAKVKLWDVATAKERVALDHPRIDWKDEMQVTCIIPELAFTADGTALGMIGFVSRSDGHVPGEEEEESPSYLVRVWDTATGRVRAELLWPYVYLESSVDARWEGIFVLDGDRNDGNERLRDPARGTERISVAVHGEPNYSMSPLWSGSSYGVETARDGAVVVVKQYGGSGPLPQWQVWLERLLPQANSSGGASRTNLALYDLPTRKCLARWRDQSFGCFAPDGRAMATSSDETTVHLWDVPPGRPWLAIFGWAVLPAGLASLFGAWWALRIKDK